MTEIRQIQVMKNNTNPQSAASITSVTDSPINDKVETDSKHKANESVPKTIGKIFVFSVLTIAVSIIFVLPWTTIPRTNSIIYQSSWMEVFLPTLSNLIIMSLTLDQRKHTDERTNIFEDDHYEHNF